MPASSCALVGVGSELESESNSISILDFVLLSTLFLDVVALQVELSLSLADALATLAASRAALVDPFFRPGPLDAFAAVAVDAVATASKFESASTSNRDLQLPILMVSAALRAACRCGTYVGNSVDFSFDEAVVEDELLLLLVFSLVLGSLLTLSDGRITCSSAAADAAGALAFVSLVLEVERTTFSLPTLLLSFSLSRSLSFSLSLSETLALVLCRLSVAFLAACRCGTIRSVVDLTATVDVVALLSFTFLPRPRPGVVDAVVAGEKALTAALVRTADEEASATPRPRPPSAVLVSSSSLSV